MPVLHAHLHVVRLPAAVPGAMRLYLQKTALPQEDHYHLDKWRSTSKHSALIIINHFISGLSFKNSGTRPFERQHEISLKGGNRT